MTLADIAGWLSLSWDTIRTVVQRRLEKDYRRLGYRKVRSIAIDELYLGRTHKYVTLVIDLESGRIIWVEQGRGSQALREFWRRFKLSGARLKAVAMDMSGAYAASVRAHAPRHCDLRSLPRYQTDERTARQSAARTGPRGP